ncbi:MAG: hypothetical protein H7330_03450 [Hymenobacteraceae bacterium]|nr:hypothetical protein [Hymenobacteraceae bacterium]
MGGIALTIASGSIMTEKLAYVQDKINSIQLDIINLEDNKKNLDNDSKQTDKQIANIKLELKNLKPKAIKNQATLEPIYKNLYVDKEYREYMAFIYEHEEKIDPSYKKLRELDQKIVSEEVSSRKAILSGKIIGAKIKHLGTEYNLLVFTLVIGSVLMTIGLVMVKLGAKYWYDLVQKPTDEKIRLELEILKKSQSYSDASS